MFRSLTSLFIASIVLLVCLSTCDSVSAQFPPNKKIVYLRGPQNQEDLWVMNSDGSGQTQVCSCPGASDHSLSPDGLRIAFSRLNNVWVINTDGTGLINLTPSGGFAGQASWSPDSQEIAFTSNRDIVQGFHVQNVYRIKIDGTNLQQLTTVDRVGVFDNYNPSWSPDGTRIAFQSERVFRAIWKRGLGVRDDETIKENGGSSSERAVFDHDRSKRMVKSEHRARKSLAAKSNEWIHLRRAPGRNVAGE